MDSESDLGDLAPRGCQHDTGADPLHHLSGWATKGLELSQGALVQGIQGSLSLFDDGFCSSQVPAALLSLQKQSTSSLWVLKMLCQHLDLFSVVMMSMTSEP